MVAHVGSVAFAGIEVLDVDVQVQMGGGLPAFMVVGLPDKAVGESRERVRAALHALGLALPPKRITVNLSPADLVKEGSHFDLPIALGVLAAMGALPADELDGYVALGELGLDGRLSAVSGVLPAAIHANSRERGLICPATQGAEAAWAGDLAVLAPADLLALINHFKGTQLLARPQPRLSADHARYPDLADIKGQRPPSGQSKSPPPRAQPADGRPTGSRQVYAGGQAARPAAALGCRRGAGSQHDPQPGRHPFGDGLVSRRPFRDPHHSASLPLSSRRPAGPAGRGVAGPPGGAFPGRTAGIPARRPRIPAPAAGNRRATVARANAHVTYPARFQLIAAMNPCRCGYLDDPAQACARAPKCAQEYQAKISGPLFDRIDLHVEVPAVSAADLALPPAAEGSATVAARIAAARQCQKARYADGGAEGRRPRTNAEADGRLLEEVAAPDEAGRRLLGEATERLKLTARGYHRVLRVARTLADLDGADGVRRLHVAEALSYRRIVPGRGGVGAGRP